MSAYRFCRSDDIALLVDALNRCWAPHAPEAPPMTAAAFKRLIRDRQVWCSSCMVAFSGSDPVGVLIGAKRPSGTLVHTIAVHPDHLRQGHGRHLLASLGSKLSILGPPRMIAEVPETLARACALFSAGGYVEEARLTDYVLPDDDIDAREAAAVPARPSPRAEQGVGRFVIPVTVDDLVANGLLGETPAPVCWERAVESLTARKDGIEGLAVASDERIEAYILYVIQDAGPEGDDETGSPASGLTADILSLRSLVDDGTALLQELLARIRARGVRTVRFPKVHPEELANDVLERSGFRPANRHVLFAATARSA